MIKRVQLVNSTQQWRANGRYKVNTVVTYLGVDYQNTTGVNSLPSLLTDWIVVSDTQIIDDLVTNSPNKALSANQGVELKKLIDAVVVNMTLFPTTVDSDISGYKKMVTSMDDADYDDVAVDIPTGVITTVDVLVSELATDTGVIFSSSGVVNVQVIGKIRKVSGTANGQFYYKVYKRDSLGTETLLATSDVTEIVSSNVYVEFSASAVWSNTDGFVSTDRIVYKFYGSKTGSGSNPSFEFEFGGATPVRSIVPVAGSVQSSQGITEDFLFNNEDLLDEEIVFNIMLPNSYLDVNGLVISSSNWNTSNLISVSRDSIYKYYGRTNIGGGVAYSVCGYDINGVFVQNIIGTNVNATGGQSFNIPNLVERIRISTYKDVVLKLEIVGVKKSIKPEFFSKKHLFDLLNEFPNSKDVMNKSWASVGTSITSNNNTLVGYQDNVMKVFSFTTFTNYGYSGYSLGGLTLADSSSICNQMTSWISHNIFSLESITNDFKRNIPIGVLSDYTNATGITTYYGALRAFANKINSLNPTAIIIVANSLKRNNAGYTSTSTNTVGHTLLDYEYALLNVCKITKWYFIDQYRESGVTDENLFATTSDGLHPNDFGYALLSRVWIEAFRFAKYL